MSKITNQLPFTIENYPKSHGSLEGWRLGEFLHLPVADQHLVYKDLERFCLHQASQCQALDSHHDYPLLGSGWEWSVFAKDDQTVVKIPSGIFPEVNQSEYLTNAQKGYQLLQDYYPASMIAKTTFERIIDTNVVTQQRLSGQDMQVIDFDLASPWLLAKLQLFLECTTKLIKEQQWLPDFWLDEDEQGFVLRNVMIDEKQDQFVIVDFTSYLDPSRMYPDLRDSHLAKHGLKINQMQSLIHNLS